MVLLLVTSARVSEQVVQQQQLYVAVTAWWHVRTTVYIHCMYLLCPNFLFVCFCKEHGKETKSLLCIYQTLLVRTLHHVHVHVDTTCTLHRSCKSLVLNYFYEII